MKRAFALVIACFAAFASPSYAATTTVTWNGSDDFNDSTITFAPFVANQLSDILGTGQYEACCRYGATNFALKLRLDGTWTTVKTWASTGDEHPHLLGDLVPAVIKFATSSVSGIKLTSGPDGGSNDPNFTNFYLKAYYSVQSYYNKFFYYKDYDDYLKCGHYEEYLKHVTQFVFDNIINELPPSPVPLPGALLLMGTMLAGSCGVMGWRRRRTRGTA